MITLSNSNLSAKIALMGAELKSLKEHATGLEYIWQSDPAHWKGASPILFPIVGGLKNGTCRINGAECKIPGHGFVRGKEWMLVSENGTSAVFETASDVETRAMFPFDFVLRVHYTLVENSLAIRYEVVNKSTGRMYFSIGSHPAFNIPFAGGSIENYYFHFSEEEKMERYFFKDGMHLNETEPAFDNARQVYLKRTLFDRGPLIFKQPRSKMFSILNSKNSKRINVKTDGVPFVALWATPNAPFACIEPWYGIPDNCDTDGEFSTKEGIMSLETGCTFNTTYSIEIL
ncbi:MAG: aldose 1-epimerase family protein [Kiritimatiellales bacterium]|nr:aldose 1-epimerase family protein [Kiritimatiellales bacterium]